MSPPNLNSVQPDLGGSPGWDQPPLPTLFTLAPGPDGVLLSPHAEVNANGAIYGGQLIGQALAAAWHGIPEGLSAHSLQLSFLAPGQTTEDLRFEVTRLLSGRSFIVQQVLCRQGERAVFSANVSFHRGEDGPAYAAPMASGLPAPEDLPTLRELVLAHADELQLDERTRALAGRSRHLEMRPVDGKQFLQACAPDGRRAYWVRVREPLPAQPMLHHAALGYLSDYWFPLVALAPHGGVRIDTRMYIASLNHAIWFHAPLRADEWLLVDARAQSTASARGLTEGQIYTRSGQRIATVLQETLFRTWQPPAERAAGA